MKVLDFGTAHDIQPAPPAQALEAGGASTVVTRTYASPEVLDGLPPEPRDDLFSLACVAYEMLAGRHPFSRVPANQARSQDMEVLPIADLAPQRSEAFGRNPEVLGEAQPQDRATLRGATAQVGQLVRRDVKRSAAFGSERKR